MSYKLEKPFTQQQKDEFLNSYNRGESMLLIEETEEALYALEDNEIMVTNDEGIFTKIINFLINERGRN